MNTRLAFVAALAIATLAVACAEEIPTESLIEPTMNEAPTAEPPPEPGSSVKVTIPDAGKPRVLDASAVSPKPACLGLPIMEAGETDLAVGQPVCADLAAKDDADVFHAKSQKSAMDLVFTAEADAELIVRGFGMTRALASGDRLEVPSMPLSLDFTLTVSSPSGAPQGYRISYDTK
jgi:hypothetical protein